MKDLYTVKFLYDTLFQLQNQLDELSEWSVYNDDAGNNDIHELKQKFEEVKHQLFDLAKNKPLEANLSEEGGDENGK